MVVFFERRVVKFPGFWVSMDAGKVVLQKFTFDETELDPTTQWKQAWQNQNEKGQTKGDLDESDRDSDVEVDGEDFLTACLVGEPIISAAAYQVLINKEM